MRMKGRMFFHGCHGGDQCNASRITKPSVPVLLRVSRFDIAREFNVPMLERPDRRKTLGLIDGGFPFCVRCSGRSAQFVAASRAQSRPCEVVATRRSEA